MWGWVVALRWISAHGLGAALAAPATGNPLSRDVLAPNRMAGLRAALHTRPAHNGYPFRLTLLHLLEALPAHLWNGDAHRRAQHRPEAEIFRPGFIFPALAHYAMNIGAFLIEDWATALCHPEFLRRMRSTALASIRLAWSNCPEKTL